jgi:hypothetical protein
VVNTCNPSTGEAGGLGVEGQSELHRENLSKIKKEKGRREGRKEGGREGRREGREAGRKGGREGEKKGREGKGKKLGVMVGGRKIVSSRPTQAR